MTGNRRLCSESNVSLFVTTEPCLVVSSLHSKSDKTAPKSSHFGHGFYFHEVFDKLACIALESPAPHRSLPLAEASALRSSTQLPHPDGRWGDEVPFCRLPIPYPITRYQVITNCPFRRFRSTVCVRAGGGHCGRHRRPLLYTRFSSGHLET